MVLRFGRAVRDCNGSFCHGKRVVVAVVAVAVSLGGCRTRRLCGARRRRRSGCAQREGVRWMGAVWGCELVMRAGTVGVLGMGAFDDRTE